ncbi:MAG: sugar ABC transporter substrate-binding protein [Oscillospiraceae bacterium]|nr:sugar ABC transporter substrate-binding protein [Oscillospiraceae bacterium]
MKKSKSAVVMLVALAMTASLAGCGDSGAPATTTAAPAETTAKAAETTTAAAADNNGGDATTAAPAAEETTAPVAVDNGENKEYSDDEIKEFTAFFAVPGDELNAGNRVQEAIAKKIGAKCKMTWLTGQTAEEAVGGFVALGEYPDFMDGSTGMSTLVEAGAFIAIDEYWDNYPNVKNFYSEADWNKIRNEDGHVYIIPQFGKVNQYDTSTVHNDEAFWIQTRVLKWAGYPKITTLDQYFDLIDSYLEANPTMEDGTPNIGYEILTDDWRYFCLENAPFFLDGYPNDGCVIIPRDTQKAVDYNTTDTAKRYFQKLNEEYGKGTVDQEFATLNYDQYIAKVSSGRVLGMVDQYWDFQTAENSIKQQGLNDCTYVPLGIVIDEGVREHYHSAPALDTSNGVGITVSCQDPEGAMKFLNDLLDPEVLKLRFWGEEGTDYLVDDDGMFYRTQEMRDNAVDKSYTNANLCPYSYFPFYGGMSFDGKNAYSPNYQPSEFYESLTDEVKECFEAYGVQTYVQLLQPSEENTPWYPMWSYSNALTADTPDGEAWMNMGEVKHEYLPKVVMAEDFESQWTAYLDEYNSRCDINAFLDGINAEIQRRIAVANGG